MKRVTIKLSIVPLFCDSGPISRPQWQAAAALRLARSGDFLGSSGCLKSSWTRSDMLMWVQATDSAVWHCFGFAEKKHSYWKGAVRKLNIRKYEEEKKKVCKEMMESVCFCGLRPGAVGLKWDTTGKSLFCLFIYRIWQSLLSWRTNLYMKTPIEDR